MSTERKIKYKKQHKKIGQLGKVITVKRYIDPSQTQPHGEDQKPVAN